MNEIENRLNIWKIRSGKKLKFEQINDLFEQMKIRLEFVRINPSFVQMIF